MVEGQGWNVAQMRATNSAVEAPGAGRSSRIAVRTGRRKPATVSRGGADSKKSEVVRLPPKSPMPLDQLQSFQVAWPSLPTMMWSCTEMPSGLAISWIDCVIWMSARDGVGSPEGWLCTRMIAVADNSRARFTTSRG